jgi:hypothetical protein
MTNSLTSSRPRAGFFVGDTEIQSVAGATLFGRDGLSRLNS